MDQSPVSGGDNNLSKHFQTIIVAGVLGIGAWLVTATNQIQQAIVRIDTSLAAAVQNQEKSTSDYEKLKSEKDEMKGRLTSLESRIQALEFSRK